MKKEVKYVESEMKRVMLSFSHKGAKREEGRRLGGTRAV